MSSARIEKMGYADYFFIVWDFIRFARERGIAVGPGRGSSAGSLVAYALRLPMSIRSSTGCCLSGFSIRNGCRMPDIDIDFSDERRDEVIEYVVEQIRSRSCRPDHHVRNDGRTRGGRDVGRVMNLPYARSRPDGKDDSRPAGMTIEKAFRRNPDLADLYKREPRVRRLIEMARKVEGMPRHASTHAAGIVISQITADRVSSAPGRHRSASPLTQYSMEHLESLGLLKMDFLGLRTLSIFERTVASIARDYGVKIDFDQIPDDDKATYELLGRGDTDRRVSAGIAGHAARAAGAETVAFEDIISVLRCTGRDRWSLFRNLSKASTVGNRWNIRIRRSNRS